MCLSVLLEGKPLGRQPGACLPSESPVWRRHWMNMWGKLGRASLGLGVAPLITVDSLNIYFVPNTVLTHAVH